MVPDGQDDGRVLQLLWSDVKADGFVENGVDGVLLEGRLLGLDGLLEVDQRNFYVRICKATDTGCEKGYLRHLAALGGRCDREPSPNGAMCLPPVSAADRGANKEDWSDRVTVPLAIVVVRPLTLVDSLLRSEEMPW